MAGAFQGDAFQGDSFESFTGGSAQAQASIKQISRAYGQANAQILNPYPRYISNTSFQQDNQTSHNISIPAVEAGDILLVVIAIDNDLSTSTSIAGFTKLDESSDGDGFVHAAIFYQIAASPASATTASVSHTTSQACAGTVLLIRNGIAIELGWAGGNDANPNPPNLTPSWGSAATLWLAFYAVDSWIDFTSQPSGYTHIQNGRYPDVGEGVSYGVSYKRATASSENPGTFTLGQASRWASYTIGIQPMGATNASAQAQAYILIKPTQSAQANADIKATSNCHAQAQGYLPSAFTTVSGQARARIAGQLLVDTFTRTESTGSIGTPDVGPTYADGVQTQNLTNTSVNGSELITTGNVDYDWIRTNAVVSPLDFVIQIDFKFSTFIPVEATFSFFRARFNTGWVKTEIYNGNLSIEATNGVTFNNANFAFTPSANTWYTHKFFASGTEVKAKVWQRGTKEPAWQVSTTASTLEPSSNIIAYADIGEPGGSTVTISQDNYFIGTLDVSNSVQNYAQAQAFIVYKRSSYAQALADIKATSNRVAQARAVIINPQWSQAQAWIKATTNAFGQAQAEIIAQISYGTGQAQAKIHRYEGYGQAQTLIDSTRGYFQAQGFIDYLWQLDETNALYFRASGTGSIVGGIVYSRDIEPGTVRVDWKINMNSVSDFLEAYIYIEAAGIESARYPVNRTSTGTYSFYLDVYVYATVNLRFDYAFGGLLVMAASTGSFVSMDYPKQGYWKLSEPNANAYSQSEYGPTGYYSSSGITYQVSTNIVNNPLAVTVAGNGSITYPLDAVLDTFTFEIWFKTSDTIVGYTDSQSSFGYASQLTTNQNYIVTPQRTFPFDTAGLTVGTNGIALVTYGAGFYQLAHYYASISSARWHHAAVVFNQRYTFLYLDGVLVHEGLRAPNTTFRPNVLFKMTSDNLGQVSSTSWYNGSATGFKVYDIPLTSAQIRDSYESGLPRGYGQAQALIKSPYAWSQAQAFISKTTQSGQATARISPGFGILFGQANAQIYRYEAYGQAQAMAIREATYASSQATARINPISSPQVITNLQDDAQTYNWTYTEGYIWVDMATYTADATDPDPVYSGLNPEPGSPNFGGWIDNYGSNDTPALVTRNGWLYFTLDREQFVQIDTLNLYEQTGSTVHDTVIGLLTSDSGPGNWTTVQSESPFGLRGGNDDVSSDFNPPENSNNLESRFRITLPAGTYLLLVGFWADSAPWQMNVHFRTTEPIPTFQAQAYISSRTKRSGQARATIYTPTKRVAQATVIITKENTRVYVDTMNRIVGANTTSIGTSTHFGTYTMSGSNTYAVLGMYSAAYQTTLLSNATIMSFTGTVPATAIGAGSWEAMWTFGMVSAGTTADVYWLAILEGPNTLLVRFDRLNQTIDAQINSTFSGTAPIPVLPSSTAANPSRIRLRYDFTTGTLYGMYYDANNPEPADWQFSQTAAPINFTSAAQIQGQVIAVDQLATFGSFIRSLQLVADFTSRPTFQALALIDSGIHQRFAQAQARIDTPYRHAQAKAIIGEGLFTSILLRDTFGGSSSGTVLPDPDIGPSYLDDGGDDTFYDNAIVSGGVLSLTGNTDYDYLQLISPISATDVDATVDFMAVGEIGDWSYLLDWGLRVPGNVGSSVELSIYYDPLQTAFIGQVSNTTLTGAPITTLSPDVWYRVRFQIIFGDVRFKIWERANPEPEEWEQEGTTSLLDAGQLLIYQDVGEGGTYPRSIQLDNLFADSISYVNTNGKFGQAQASIKAVVRNTGQAQARIKTTRAYGQARARIKLINKKFGQANALIRIKGGSFQARASIRYTWKHAQARAKIIVPNPVVSGQAQGYTKRFNSNQAAQALAQINLHVSVGQAMAFVGTFKTFQAQALIRQISQQKRAQAQARIKNTYKQTGQVNALIVREVTNKFGQAQGRIFAASTKSGQAQAFIMSPHPVQNAQAAARIVGIAGNERYLVRLGGWILPGFAQREEYDSVMNTDNAYTGSTDGSKTEETGLANKEIRIDMKIVADTYLQAKLEAQRATTIVRSARAWEKLYIQREDRYLLVLTKKISYDQEARNRHLDYQMTFHTKPWWFGEEEHFISGTGTITTTGRTLYDGTWTPARLVVSGTNVTVSGYNALGSPTGFVSVSGSVNGLVIDSEEMTAILNDQDAETLMINKDYKMYIGPGETTFDISGATDVEISWYNRWDL